MGVTAFTLLQYWLDGRPEVEPFLDYCQQYKLMPRVLGMNRWADAFVPGRYGRDRYLHGIADLAVELVRRGVGLKLSVMADRQHMTREDLFGLNDVDFLLAIGERVRDLDILLDAGNEFGAYPEVIGGKNGFNPQDFRVISPRRMLQSRGSAVGDALPPINPMDFADFHADRGDQWPRKPKSIYDIKIGQTNEKIAIPRPIMQEEWIAIGETEEPGRTSASPQDCLDGAAATALFADGYILHHRGTMYCQLPGPVSQACFDASLAGVQAIPAAAREGQYTRGGFSDFPLLDSPLDRPDGDPIWWLRAYGKIYGGHAVVVIIRGRPEKGLHVEAVNGWRIIDRFGDDRRSIVWLSR